jgi:Lon-like protease
MTQYEGAVPQELPLPQEERRSRRPSASTIGWLLLVLGVAGSIVLGLLPAPYVIEQPGPVYDTLGSTNAEGSKAPLIAVDGAKTYTTSGTLDLLTVSVVGSREQPLNWIDVATAWFDQRKAVVPIEAIYPVGVTQKQSDAESAAEMSSSQREAIAAAERELGYDVPGVVGVDSVLKGSAAAGLLKADDQLVSVNGTPLDSASALRQAIQDNGTGKPIEFGIRRGGVESTVSITPKLGDAGDGTKVPLIGIITNVSYDYPVKVSISLDRVGGPSAGMMFALGIIDKLTPGALTGGQKIAGTGTIDASGQVGAIGGIRQKLYGAREAGARWFLAPASNCDEVVGHIPSGLTVYAVSTLDQARTAVTAIATGDGRSQLATCTGK